ncbi:hypothetical protein ABB02_02057 [Clostridiaceae bacterium JG1575]|nr:hypothetical protein ABB02_02057 [Clostridiaceae bacterium JG1575]
MALTVEDILKGLEALAPLAMAESWDCPGLALGDPHREVTSILLALDVTPQVIEEAKNLGVQLILVHHPFFFRPVQEITSREPKGRMIQDLIQAQIAVLSAHTNLDAAPGGMNDEIMALLGLPQWTLLPWKEYPSIGRLAVIEPTPLEGLAQSIGAALDTPALRRVGPKDQRIQRLAVVNGSGMDYLKDCVNAKADCLLTGDVTHHAAQDALDLGICIIDAGHFCTEWMVFTRLMERMLGPYQAKEPALKVWKAKTAKDPFQYQSIQRKPEKEH